MSSEALDTLTDVIGLLIVITFFGSAISVAYIARIYQGSGRSSQIFRMLIRADAIKVAAAGWIGLLAVIRLAVLPDGTTFPTWTTPITAVAVELLLLPPILHALTIRRLRRNRQGSPPPWDPED